MATQNQDRLRTHFSSLETTPTAQGSGWDSLWESASFLPWDRGYANPALIDLLAHPSSPPTSSDANPTPGAPSPSSTPSAIELPRAVEGGKRKKVLVPGCGKGYDVALFAAYGYDAYGLEVSQHAAKAADAYLENAGAGSLENEYEGKDGGAGRGSAVCLVGDFFAASVKEDGGAWLEKTGGTQFDVIYDNTVRLAYSILWRREEGDGRKWLTFPVSLRTPAIPPPAVGSTRLRPPRAERHTHLSRVPHAQARVLGRSAVVLATHRTLGAVEAARGGDIV
jgi:SAM-dependent methyltransferase